MSTLCSTKFTRSYMPVRGTSTAGNHIMYTTCALSHSSNRPNSTTAQSACDYQCINKVTVPECELPAFALLFKAELFVKLDYGLIIRRDLTSQESARFKAAARSLLPKPFLVCCLERVIPNVARCFFRGCLCTISDNWSAISSSSSATRLVTRSLRRHGRHPGGTLQSRTQAHPEGSSAWMPTRP
jgi:hypothetical protein